MPEGVGDVAHVHAPPELVRRTRAVEQVPDDRLGAHEELVGEHGPGPDQEAAGGDVSDDLPPALGADREVVVEDDRLAVEREVTEVGVALEHAQKEIHQVDQLDAHRLKGEIPLPVPVGVRDDVNGDHPTSRPGLYPRAR